MHNRENTFLRNIAHLLINNIIKRGDGVKGYLCKQYVLKEKVALGIVLSLAKIKVDGK